MSNSQSLCEHFAKNGYVIVPGAIPQDLIDNLLQAQRRSRRNPLLIYRGQGVVGYERARWNAQGQMMRSMQNPHLLGFVPKLSNAIRRLVFNPSIAEALHASTGIQRWVNWQTMLFDRSVGTEVHLDTWFLDTNPRGHLIGIWIALEDITPESGPFLIYPRSHNLPVATEMACLGQLNDRTVQLRTALLEASIDPKPLLLRKGDVVLWNSLLAHGSELPSTAGATRKSVTAHFYPYGMHVASPPIRRLGSIYNHSRPIQVHPGQLWQAAVIPPWLYSTLCLSMFALQALRTSSITSGSIRRV
jgi:ectoine hydroxylase-related dioxygenase (phytanoyl-CoA dioxygenase family)